MKRKILNLEKGCNQLYIQWKKQFKEIQLGDEVEKILFIQKIATKTESVCNNVISIT